MATLNDLYTYYSQRWHCKPNSGFSTYLDEEYAKRGNKRILYTVDVSNLYCGKKGIIPILDLVKNIKTVIYLNVSNNRLEHEQLEHLVYCLVLHPSIERISLANNCLHDGSADHIIKLLEANCSITEVDVSGNKFLPASIALIEEKLRVNKAKREQIAKEQKEIEAYREERKQKVYQAQVSGQLTEENSGGYLHCSTWWKNPQYSFRVSKSTRVSIVMDIADGIEARQGGFVIMKYDGIRRVVEVGSRTIVTESPVNAKRCVVEVYLEDNIHYVIMPFTFNQGRTMTYTLSAKLVHDKPTLDEGWVTIDLLDAQYDWFTHSISTAWTDKGGSAAEKTWRYNDMFRIRYTGKPQPYFVSAPATMYALLWKEIDPDNNDEREIGLDIVDHDVYSKGKPPLLCTPDVVRYSKPHERKVAILMKFTVQPSDLDLFVVPSTKTSNQPGNFTLVLFGTAPFEMTASSFPHNWNYRSILGCWDEDACGGNRGSYQSWKNNPAIELSMVQKEKPTPMVICLELGHTKKKAVKEDEEKEPLDLEEVSPDALKHTAMIAQFWEKHTEKELAGCIAAVDGTRPHYPVRRTTDISTTETCMTLIDTTEPFYLVPMARHAGQMGDFRVHIFCEDPFVLEGVKPLATREREAQLAQYADENKSRKMQLLEDGVRHGGAGAHRSAIVRSEIIRKCLTTGIKFSDRDFPRGTSSIWLDPEGKPPVDFPDKYTWQRLAEMVTAEDESVECLSSGSVPHPPYPYSKREWFASVIHALSAKPHWLSRIFLHYDQQSGFAQFRFFKCNEWVEITVDDFVPVDTAGALCLGHSTSRSDVFFSLAEKAYAKLHRCYEALERKVAPELSLIETLSHGLTDVSGGVCTTYNLKAEPGVIELEDAAKNDLWRKLKEASKSSSLHSLLLRSDSENVGERRHAGLLADHLYGVMDARFIEKQRLVKVRNWQDGRDTEWKGKWAAHSPSWTDTLLEVLEYDHNTQEMWLSFDEVLYYFTDLLVTEQHSSVSSVEGRFVPPRTYADDTDVRLRSPQFSLNVSDVVVGAPSVDVIIGVHQEDARTIITRDRDARARYRNAIGFAVLCTTDNKRHVKKVEEKEVMRLVTPFRARDRFVKVTLSPEQLKDQQLTVMPFREHERDTDTRYIITAWSSDALVEVVPVDPNATAELAGAWTTATAGGPPNCATWRDNQQFFLFPSETMEVSVFVASCDDGALANPLSIGFTVHDTRSCSSFLHFEPSTVVLDVPSQPTHSIGGTVTLSGMKERRGMPYVVVPYCGDAGAQARFTLKVIANKKMSLTPIEPRLDWRRHAQTLCLRSEDGTTGGAPSFPSWRYNPQLVIDFPVIREGKMLISVANRNAADTRNPVGMILLRGDTRWERGHRRKLLYNADDIIAQSEEALGRVEVEVDVGFCDVTEPFILIPYTTTPYREVDLDVSIYAAADIAVTPVKEWKYTCLQEGNWDLGQTTGGSRSNFACWINNPFLGLSVIRKTNVVMLLIQYPRASEKPLVKRHGNKKAFLPPPLEHPDRRTAIELDLTNYDKELTRIAHAGPSDQAEVAIVETLEACDDRPYLVVPATTLMEQNIDYKVFVWADHPIDLFPVEKDRLWYV